MTKAKTPAPPERIEQMALVSWLNYHPKLNELFHKTNNEGQRTERQGYNLKRMGLRPGVSDIHIYYPTSTYHGLWLEVKRNKKYTPSERSTATWIAQEKFIETVKRMGYAGAFCFGWEHGKEIIERYLLT